MFPDCGGFVDVGIVFREGGFLFVERYAVGSWRHFVDGVDQDQPGYFSGRTACQVDRQTSFEEDHPYVAEVVVGGRADDGRERRNGGGELGGDVGHLRHRCA